MPKPVAVVDPQLCQPERCEGGVCRAMAECERNILKQEEPYQVPYADFSLCRGCMKCYSACPVAAIKKMA
jgi:translation initiation factor RLI1